MESREDNLPPGNVCYKLVDVDYYVDMKALMLEFKPILMYTFAPFEPAGSCADGVYFTENDEVHVQVAGGARYKHQLWDWDTDSLVSSGWLTTVVYHVEQRIDPADLTRRLILLIPVRKVFLFGVGPCRTLGRRQLTYGNYNKTTFMMTEGSKATRFLSFSLPGSTSVATVPEDLAITMALKVSRCKESIMPSVEGAIRTYMAGKVQNFSSSWWISAGDPCIRAAVLTDVLEKAPHLIGLKTPPLTVFFQSRVHYTCVRNDALLDMPKETVRLLVPQSKAYVDGVCAPTACITNDKAGIKGRVEDIRNANARVPPRFDHYLMEFIDHCVPEHQRGTGVPVDMDEVIKRQPRPTQRRIISRCINWLYDFVGKKPISSFQKRELYGKRTVPRNISTFVGSFKVRYSRYTYALAVLFKTKEWYAFSKTPKQLMERMKEVLAEAGYVIPTDFSRFDGHRSKWMNDAFSQLLKRFFAMEFHKDIDEVYGATHGCTGYTRHGVQYEQGDSQASGSPDTSLSNTFLNALIAYITLRTGGASVDEAINGLGIYGGDDGVTANVQARCFQSTCDKVGLVVKIERVELNEPVPFLGRLFFGNWLSGDIASVMDLRRQLMKLHATTASRHVPDWVVLLRKAEGYFPTDQTTPLIGEWCLAVKRAAMYRSAKVEGFEELLREEEKWFAQYDSGEQFPKLNGEQRAQAFDVLSWNLRTDPAAIAMEVSRLEGLAETCEIDELFPGNIFGGDASGEIPAIAGPDLIQGEAKKVEAGGGGVNAEPQHGDNKQAPGVAAGNAVGVVDTQPDAKARRHVQADRGGKKGGDRKGAGPATKSNKSGGVPVRPVEEVRPKTEEPRAAAAGNQAEPNIKAVEDKPAEGVVAEVAVHVPPSNHEAKAEQHQGPKPKQKKKAGKQKQKKVTPPPDPVVKKLVPSPTPAEKENSDRMAEIVAVE